DMPTPPLMYADLAKWWPLLSPPGDYEEEAAHFATLFRELCPPPRRTLLELGSGGGNNALWLKRAFDRVTLVDLAPGMVAVSRALNPDCEHQIGDMRTFRLGRTFDCVFVHDAICYMTTLDDLRAVFETARVHCRPGGMALFAPDMLRETFLPGSDHGGSDDGARGLRYLDWVWDPDPNDTTYVVDYAYLLRESDGSTRVLHDRHIEGLFPKADWLRLLGESGFQAHAVPYRHSEVENEITLFVGIAK
ncbi:MAG: class I SAM-dependent methyltransferase, partial [Longimicrobiales bacterium]